jgi:pimeloyl-ACP methyl ester carboxylesterase
MERLPALAAAAAVLLASLALPSASATGTPCPLNATDPALTTLPYQVTVGGAVAKGKYAYPTAAPKAIVLFGHGWTGDVLNKTSYDSLLVRLAKAGAVAVAMDFRGSPADYKVFTGAEDTAAAAEDWLARCGDLPVVLWGASMGGHISAWTVMSHPGLADYLVDDVGPTNIPELMAEIVPGLLSQGAMAGSLAVHHGSGIAPTPCGGGTNFPGDLGDYYSVDPDDPTDDPTGPSHLKACRIALQAPHFLMAAYGYSVYDAEAGTLPDAMLAKMVETSPALNEAAWTGSGLTHAYLVYGSADTLVPPDHGAQLQRVLMTQGIPSDLYVAAYRGAPTTSCLPTSCKAFAGIAPATHYGTAESLVMRLLAQLGTPSLDGGSHVGLATPEDSRLKSVLPAAAPATGQPAVDGPVGGTYTDAVGPYRQSGYYPDP